MDSDSSSIRSRGRGCRQVASNDESPREVGQKSSTEQKHVSGSAGFDSKKAANNNGNHHHDHDDTTSLPPTNSKLSHHHQHHHSLSFLLRFYIFALHGYFIEVNFTAIWNFIENGCNDFRFSGNSSIWSLLIYGSCGLVFEKMSYYFRRVHAPLLARGVAYLLVAYAWEFTFGLILSYFNACPWDYSGFQYNLFGVITLEYAPFWLLSGLISERILLGPLDQLQWTSSSTDT